MNSMSRRPGETHGVTIGEVSVALCRDDDEILEQLNDVAGDTALDLCTLKSAGTSPGDIHVLLLDSASCSCRGCEVQDCSTDGPPAREPSKAS